MKGDNYRKVIHLTEDEFNERMHGKRNASAQKVIMDGRKYLSLIPDVLKTIDLVLTPCPRCGAPTINVKRYACIYCKYDEIKY